MLLTYMITRYGVNCMRVKYYRAAGRNITWYGVNCMRVKYYLLQGECDPAFGSEFIFTVHAKELIIGDIYVRIYNEQPTFSLEVWIVCLFGIVAWNCSLHNVDHHCLLDPICASHSMMCPRSISHLSVVVLLCHVMFAIKYSVGMRGNNFFCCT